MSNAPAVTTSPPSKLGLIGLGMVVLGTTLSPTGMFGITLPITRVHGTCHAVPGTDWHVPCTMFATSRRSRGSS
jgi:hypothetical protein